KGQDALIAIASLVNRNQRHSGLPRVGACDCRYSLPGSPLERDPQVVGRGVAVRMFLDVAADAGAEIIRPDVVFDKSNDGRTLCIGDFIKSDGGLALVGDLMLDW